MMTPVELIKETLDYYTKNERSLDIDHVCLYQRDDGAKCAVGRCLDWHYETRILEFNHETFDVLRDEFHDDDEMFQPKYRGLPKGLWSELQDFHDDDDFWDSKKLTVSGQIRYKQLLQKWKNYEA